MSDNIYHQNMIEAKTFAKELADGIRTAAPGWFVTISDDYDQRNIEVALPDGAGLSLSVSPYRQQGRVVVHGNYPRETQGRNRVGEITIALSRGPEAIVRDITRRFLPDYLPSYARAIAEQQEADDFKAKKAANLGELADILGVKVQDRSEQAYFYQNHITVTVKDTSYGSASLQMSVPLDLARQIVTLVAAYNSKA